jgi:hypothetical protein
LYISFNTFNREIPLEGKGFGDIASLENNLHRQDVFETIVTEIPDGSVFFTEANMNARKSVKRAFAVRAFH